MCFLLYYAKSVCKYLNEKYFENFNVLRGSFITDIIEAKIAAFMSVCQATEYSVGFDKLKRLGGEVTGGSASMQQNKVGNT